MLIKVIYTRGGMGLVEDTDLDNYIKSRKILAFERSDGLATVGRDPVRQINRDFFGPNRRRDVR